MRDILITGFPHSGTTILRELISRCNNSIVNNKETFDINTLEKSTNKIRCIKYPFALNRFYTDEFKELTIIHLIRNPLWVFSSIKRRTGSIKHKNHDLESWKRSANIYIKENRHNVIKLRYEDLFIEDRLDCLLNSLGLEFTDIKTGTRDTITANEKEHSKYRSEQVKLDFQNMNTPGKVTLNAKEIMNIIKTEQYKSIYR